jgi:elongation factor Tu
MRNKLERTKPHANVGTLGQFGHGKTTLTSAITIVQSTVNATQPKSYDEIDGPPEERERGVTINTSRVEYETDMRHYAHVDCPMHEDYIKNLITGATQMDGAILVVDASEGPTSQTKEHVVLAKQTGVQAFVVFLNQQYMGEEEDSVEAVEAEVRQLLNECGYSGYTTPVISGSALDAVEHVKTHPGTIRGENASVDRIHDLLQAMDQHIPLPELPIDKPFLHAVQDVGFNADGQITAQGRVDYGRVRVGDRVEVVGIKRTRETIVCGIEMFGKTYAEATAGDNISLVLERIAKGDLERGMVVAMPNTIKPYIRFESETYILTRDEGGRHTPFFSGSRPQFYFRTTDVTGQITAFTSDEGDSVEMVMPGDRIKMSVELICPVAIEQGMRFAIREGGRTIGAGVVSKTVE